LSFLPVDAPVENRRRGEAREEWTRAGYPAPLGSRSAASNADEALAIIDVFGYLGNRSVDTDSEDGATQMAGLPAYQGDAALAAPTARDDAQARRMADRSRRI
jgi:hypothetical protein